MQGQPGRDVAIPSSAALVRVRGLVVALRRAMFGVGPVATARALLRGIRRKDPAVTQPYAGLPQGPHPFDEEHGVETGGFRSWRELQTGGANDPYISGYIGVGPSIARRLIGMVEDPEQYAFVDLGCGKGRALVIASERPFRRVIGVEIAAELAGAAAVNAQAIRTKYPRRPEIEVLQADAATFVLPPGPLVLFLYQPFEMPVMRAVAASLAKSLAASPRPAIVIYVFPVLRRAFDRLPILERAAEGTLEPTEEERPYGYAGRDWTDHFMIWRTRATRPGITGERSS